jgi:hypothetical protein
MINTYFANYSNRGFGNFLSLCCAVALVSLTASADDDTLEASFKNPPDSARPQTMYHWMNGNISKAGITKDLEAMKAVGIGGVLLFDTTSRIPEGDVLFGTEAWHDHIAFLAGETRRLGLDLSLHNCAGWSSTGGPWVTPEMSMKCLIWTETPVSAITESTLLRRPGVEDLKPPYADKRNSILNDNLLFYRDIAVIAFPKPVDGQAVDKADIRILTDHMQPDGTLNWQPPPGVWTVLRLGYTSTGIVNSQAASTGRGLEIDKLSRAAVDVHWEHFLDRVIDRIGPEALKYIEIDSFEKGDQNWTEGLDQTFRRKLGYDPIPYLIAHAGYTVDNPETTSRFLWDFQSVVAGLMHENYFGYFREKCNAYGIKFANETFGNGPFDSATVAMIPDLPMGEYWSRNHRRGLTFHWSARIAASGARLTGKRVVGAEALTEMSGDFSLAVRDFKAKTDEFIAIGLNAFFFHTFAHQPWHDDVLPGMTMGPFGVNYHRNNTWFSHTADWHAYLSRCSHILQSGDYMADILLLDGEDLAIHKSPGRLGELDPPPMAGFQHDHGSIASGILDCLRVDEDGTLRVVYDGETLANRYSFLWIRSSSLMRTPTAARLGALAEQGAAIFCERPTGTPSLADAGDLTSMVERYWDSGLIRDPRLLTEALEQHIADCEVPEGVHFSRTRIDDADYYFVANTGPRQRGRVTDVEYPFSENGAGIHQFSARFRVSGKLPEIWNPMDGTIKQAASWRQLGNGQTEVKLSMEEAGSRFVVFRNPTQNQRADHGQRVFIPGKSLKGEWVVSFDPNFGPSEPVTFEELSPWNEHSNPKIRHFSGTALYQKTFEVAGGKLPTHLDLGRVDVLATVTLNGERLGTLWMPPYRIAIEDTVRFGKNNLEIEVVNLWVNRLVGDAATAGPISYTGRIPLGFPEWLTQRRLIPTEFQGRSIVAFQHWQASDSLKSSGLLGPVFLGVIDEVTPAVVFASDFSAATQSGGGINAPVHHGGVLGDGFVVSPITAGSGIQSLQLNKRVEGDPFVSEVAGTNRATTLEQAIAFHSYMEFTVEGDRDFDLSKLNFAFRANGSTETASVTVRSSVDDFSSDLATVTGIMQGKYPGTVDLANMVGFTGLKSVTFRFYLYSDFQGPNNRYMGIDDLVLK